MSEYVQIYIALAVVGLLLLGFFALMINGLDGLHNRVKKLEDARIADKRDAWEAGFNALAAEEQKQRRDPRHPITRTNPYTGDK